MLVRLSQDWKAFSPMLVTRLPSIFAGITSFPNALSSQSEMVTVLPLISYFKIGSLLHPPMTMSSGNKTKILILSP